MKIFNRAFILLIITQHVYSQSSVSSDSLHFLEPGDIIESNKPGLRIFCHNAKTKYFMHMWRTLTLNLDTNIDMYDLYTGKTPEDVLEKHEDNQRAWIFNVFGTKKSKQLAINPFENTCIGVYTYRNVPHRYITNMTMINVDVWRLMTMLLGITLFWFAQRLSHNTVFYYLCGIALGVTMSVAILIYFASKIIMPKGKTMYLMVLTGWTMSVYLAQMLWENAQLIVMQYREWVMWYILCTSLISFIICYRFGPVTNARTKKIIQWFLQALGLGIIYHSSYFHEASLSCCVVNILLYNFPLIVIQKGRKY